jgi:spore coat protein CotH
VTRPQLLLTGVVTGLLLVGCGPDPVTAPATTPTTTPTSTPTTTPTTAPATSRAATSSTRATGGTFFDPATVQSLSIEVDPAAYTELVTTYRSTGEKAWLHAAVTIKGTRYEDVGLRLKGNLTLREVTTSTDPADVPFLVKLDKYVGRQDVDGWTDLAVRSSTSETALTESVALDLLDVAGLASEKAVSVRFSVNGGAPALRLVVQSPDSTWEDVTFGGPGALYKAEAGGDWSYRGEDHRAYEDVFDQESGEDDLAPLIDLLDFLNNSSDADFAAQLEERLDVRAFARYLAFEELVANRDDIEGGGNNSYLRLDRSTGVFTVVAWDHNSAFGGGIGPGGGQGRMRGGGRGGSSGSRTNVLVQRFTAVPTFAALVEEARTDLAADLYGSGAAERLLAARVAVLKTQAADLVDTTVVDAEASRVAAYFAG